jgi:hypothetical protein
MTAVWLLPVVSTIVAAASGGVVAEILPNPQHALWTLITSYILWGTGVPLAMVILVMYFHRLTVHRLSPREVIVSVFLPLGPLGQGGFAIMQLGKVAWKLFPRTDSLGVDGAGKILYVVGFGLALIMWGYGLVWLFFALASISRSKFPFNMVRLAACDKNSNLRLTLDRAGGDSLFQSESSLLVQERSRRSCQAAFSGSLPWYASRNSCLRQKCLSWTVLTLSLFVPQILSLAVMCLWLLVATRTAIASASGKIFYAPCVVEYEKERIKKELELAGVAAGEKLVGAYLA